MTVQRTYKPTLFQEFKASLVLNSRMHMLAAINFDIGEALIHLGITDQAQLYQAIKGTSV